MNFVVAWVVFSIFILGLLLFLLLESEVNYPQTKQRLVFYFMESPAGYEFIVQMMILALPVGLILLFLPAIGNPRADSAIGLIIALTLWWPVIMYQVHRRFHEFSIKLGLTSREFKELDRILVARLNIFGWIIAAVSLALGLFVIPDVGYEIVDIPLKIGGLTGILLLPLRESIAILRKRDQVENEDWLEHHEKDNK